LFTLASWRRQDALLTKFVEGVMRVGVAASEGGISGSVTFFVVGFFIAAARGVGCAAR